MSFYGIPTDDLKKVIEATTEIGKIYNKHGRTFFAADNLITVLRNHSFSADRKFTDAFNSHNVDGTEQHKIWRLHTYCWAGRSALSLPGDFVECGVYKGFYSAILAHYLDFEKSGKQLYLYDSFAGIPDEWSEPEEREGLNSEYDWDGTHEAVVELFSKYSNAHVIKGVVPEILLDVAPKEIALLHIDLNAAAAETATLDVFYDRICDGGIVLMDDYGRLENRLLHEALRDWWVERNHAVLELPTGQGLVIKRG